MGLVGFTNSGVARPDTVLVTYPVMSAWSDDHTPLAYLITFRCYGTWLHGDERGSIDRFHNTYGTPLIPPNNRWLSFNESVMNRPPVELDRHRRDAIRAAIEETCQIRQWVLHALNARTNHVHSVVSADCGPKLILSVFKANATRKMREDNCWTSAHTPWSPKGSKRYIWTERGLAAAIDYVINGQGGEPPDSFD